MTWSLKKYGPATARVLFDHIVVQLGQHTIAYAQHSPERSNETNTQVRHQRALRCEPRSGALSSSDLTDRPSQKIDRILTSDASDIGIGIAACDQPADDVLAVGWRLESVEIGCWEFAGQPTCCPTSCTKLVESDVVAHESVGADANVLHSNELHKIVIMVEHAIDV